MILSDDPARLQFDRIHDWLTHSYWSPGIARNRVERAAANAWCLGAYDENGVQLGYARAITDRATFAWIADVFVDEAARGQGLGRQLVGWFLDHPELEGVRRIALVTADAHGVYQALGFHAPIRPERYMERLAPGVADMLRAAP
jgi:GNAT superfamily N-acetyltransferase